MVRGYEPGGEDHEFDPRLGNFISFLIKEVKNKQLITSNGFMKLSKYKSE